MEGVGGLHWGCVHGRGHVWQEGYEWWGCLHGRGVCMTGGMHCREKWQLQWAVHILLEYILVLI